MNGELPETACCRTCGYLLRGLPEPTCPECGRPFDPADPRTYAPSAAWRWRRKWVPRMVAVVVLAALGLIFAPRGSAKGKIVFTCQQCGHTVVVQRWTPYPAEWLPIRYPGFSWTSAPTFTPPATQPTTPCTQHLFIVDARQTFPGGGAVSARAGPGSGPVRINDIRATPASASAILDSMLALTGVTISHMDPNSTSAP